MDDRLNKFRVVVERGGFTSASEELHISQPALTMAVRKLERELGVQLLVRHERQIELTPAGAIAYQTACAQQATRHNMQTALTELGEERLSLSLGMIDSVAATIGDNVEVLERLENVADVAMLVNNSRNLCAGVLGRELEGAFVVEPEQQTGLDTLARLSEDLVLVTAPGKLPMVQAQLEHAILESFISYDAGSHTSAYIQRAFESRGLAVSTTFYSTSPDVMLRLVRKGRGVATLPYSLVREDLRRGDLALVTSGGAVLAIERPIAFVVRENIAPPRAVHTFIQDLANILDQYSAEFRAHQP